MGVLDIEFAGLKLKSPVIVSSGPQTSEERLIRKAAQFGPGAIVIKSNMLEADLARLFPPKPGKPGEYGCARPKFARANKTSYIHCDSGDLYTSEIWAERIRRLKKEIDVPIIASQWGTTIETHVKTAKMYEQAGADALEVDFCPLPAIIESAAISVQSSRNSKLVADLVRSVKKAVKFPVGVKGSPDPITPAALATAARDGGADFVHVLGFTLGAPEIDVETGRPVLQMFGSLFGPMRKQFTLRNVSESARSIGYDGTQITSSGGIMNWRDAVEYFMYGATTVQLCSAIHKRGYKVIKEINDGLSDYLEKHGFNSVLDIRGAAHKYLLTSAAPMAEKWLQTEGKIIAEVDEARCNLCGICADTCFMDAIEVKGKRLVISRTECEGCGLCVANCPRDAVRLLNTDIYFR